MSTSRDAKPDTKSLERGRENRDKDKESTMRKKPEKRKGLGPTTERRDNVAKSSIKKAPDKKDFKPKPKADTGKALKTMENKGYAKANSPTRKSTRGR